MKAQREFAVGDKVFVEGTTVRESTVVQIRTFTRRVKIILADKSEWTATGFPWRAGGWHAPRLRHPTSELEHRLCQQQAEVKLRWLISRDLTATEIAIIDKLYEDVRGRA
jgi:hypothetical protein